MSVFYQDGPLLGWQSDTVPVSQRILPGAALSERSGSGSVGWPEAFLQLMLAFNDPGEPPLKGGLLVAPYGKGYFVYTALVFFRELQAGVPGAFRLFANLISLGK